MNNETGHFNGPSEEGIPLKTTPGKEETKSGEKNREQRQILEVEKFLSEKVIKDILDNPDVIKETKPEKKREKIAYYLFQARIEQGIAVKELDEQYGIFNENSARAYRDWDWSQASQLLDKGIGKKENLSGTKEHGPEVSKESSGEIATKEVKVEKQKEIKEEGKLEEKIEIPKTSLENEFSPGAINKLIERNQQELNIAEKTLKDIEIDFKDKSQFTQEHRSILRKTLSSARTFLRATQEKFKLAEEVALRLGDEYGKINTKADKFIAKLEARRDKIAPGIQTNIDKIKQKFTNRQTELQKVYEQEVNYLVAEVFERFKEKIPKDEEQLLTPADLFKRIDFYQNSLKELSLKTDSLKDKELSRSGQAVLNNLLTLDKEMRERIEKFGDVAKSVHEDVSKKEKEFQEKRDALKKEEKEALGPHEEELAELNKEFETKKEEALTQAKEDKEKAEQEMLAGIEARYKQIDQRSKIVNQLLNTLEIIKKTAESLAIQLKDKIKAQLKKQIKKVPYVFKKRGPKSH